MSDGFCIKNSAEQRPAGRLADNKSPCCQSARSLFARAAEFSGRAEARRAGATLRPISVVAASGRPACNLYAGSALYLRPRLACASGRHCALPACRPPAQPAGGLAGAGRREALGRLAGERAPTRRFPRSAAARAPCASGGRSERAAAARGASSLAAARRPLSRSPRVKMKTSPGSERSSSSSSSSSRRSRSRGPKRVVAGARSA